jgi:hypothetical protein
MKTKILLLAAIAAIVSVPGLSMAQGFGHYPQKGAYDLKLQPVIKAAQPVSAYDSVPMSCPKCKDALKPVSIPFAKGTQVNQTRLVAEHMCPSCATTIKTVGMGKYARNTLLHNCNGCGSTDTSCCATSKNSGKTAGM